MNPNEFLRQLEYELRSLPAEERDNAIQYYRDYLADADDVQAALESLGSPKKVAADILSQFGSVPAPSNPPQQIRFADRISGMESGQKALMAALIVIAAICILPVCIAGGGSILGILIAVIVVIFAAFLVFLALGIGLLIAAVTCLISILFILPTTIANILILVGVSLLLLGGSLLSFAAFWWICATLFPSIIRGIASLGRRIFHPKGGSAV